jgi:hypothetical protein
MMSNKMNIRPQPASRREQILERVVDAVASLRGYVTMSLGGSVQAGFDEAVSDLDIHVLWEPPLAEPEERIARLQPLADAGTLRVGVRSWGLEDQLVVDGVAVELIYFHLGDMRSHIDEAYRQGLKSEGFTTAMLYNIATGRPLHDPRGTLREMQVRLNHAFPEATRAYLLRHYPPHLLYYLRLLAKAQQRQDWLYAQSASTGFHSLFFNLLFTLNRRYHPGGKRLLLHSATCPVRPIDNEARWQEAARLPMDDPRHLELLAELSADLIALIKQHGGVEVLDQVQ